MGNIVFGALSKEYGRKVVWSIVMKDLVQKLVVGMGKSKSTSIYRYIFNLY